MGKFKRNEPCPCGSGKKYKKCCGVYNVVEFNPTIYNTELYQLHDQLIDFAIKVHGDTLTNQADKFKGAFSEETEKAFNSCLTLWSILNVPVQQTDETIFNLFFKKYNSKFRFTRTKEVFSNWGQHSPSIFEVIEIEVNNQFTVKDLFSKETYQVPNKENNEYEIGELLTGTLVPFIGYHDFFFNTLKINGEKKFILDTLNQHYNKENGLAESYPNLLSDLLKKQSSSNDWKNPIHEDVANLFSEHLKDKGFPKEFIELGVVLWQNYCLQKQPKLKNPATFAAALDYLMQVSFVENHEATQGGIAKEYGTSAGTVSSNYRKLSEVLSDKLGNNISNKVIDASELDHSVS
ncbi:SEC-C domain-containing protein [Aquibacillus kalidii]|uniref:SEC-C domain-containing protein n=1 Tax=Aquibacillus kalidii TaxID=2762597 RepID=UPI00164745AB|nr:SEC-C domain-containing protein [Aquibacillus kalidii]